MITNGAYLSSKDILTEATFNKVVEEARSQAIECKWTWEDYQRVQGDSGTNRLVARMHIENPYLDVEASPFANRTRWSVDQWLGFDTAPKEADGIPETHEPMVVLTVGSVVNLIIDFDNFMYANAHELCGFSKDTHTLDGWDVHNTSKDVFRFMFFFNGNEVIPQKVRRARIEALMKVKYANL